jgi:hypothetical protein
MRLSTLHRMDEINFFCAVCGANVSARAEKAGSFCDCPRCLRVIPVPGNPARPNQSAAGAAAPSPQILGIEIKFLSGCCGEKLRVDAQLQGVTLDCPLCHQPTKVPEWSGALLTAPIAHPPTRAAAPMARLSPEECEFLSTPIRDTGKGLLAVGSP